MTGWRPPTIETPRLILRAINASDAAAIFEYAKNPNVSRLTCWQPHSSIADTEAFIRDYIFKHYSEGTPEPFGITLKNAPDKVIGTVGCFWVSKPAKSMELAYAISEDHWGKGIVTEAADAVVNYCFRELKPNRIQARCKLENEQSAKIMKKIGMDYEGTLRASMFHNNRLWDVVYYAKINDEIILNESQIRA